MEIKKKTKKKTMHAITIDNRAITYAVVPHGQTLLGWVWPRETTNAVTCIVYTKVQCHNPELLVMVL